MRFIIILVISFLPMLSSGATHSYFTSYPAGYDTDGEYLLAWQSVTGSGLNFWVDEYKDGAYLEKVATSGTGVTLSGRADGTYTYNFWIRQRYWNSQVGGYRYKSAQYDSVTVEVLNTPGQVSSLSGVPSSSSNGVLTISWGVSSGSVVSYELEQQTNGGNWQPVPSGSGQSKAVSLSNGSYRYQVRACNAGGCGPYRVSGVVDVALPPPVPGTLGLLDTQSATADNDGIYRVTWGAASGNPFTGYKVYEQKNSGSWIEIYSSTNTSVRQVQRPSGCASYPSSCSSPLGDGAYTYKVVSYVTVGNYTRNSTDKLLGTSVNVLKPPSAPGSFTQPVSAQISTVPFTVSWGAATGGGLTYTLEYSVDNVNFNSYASELNGTSITTVSLSNGQYYLRAKACNASGCGYTNAPKSISINVPLPKPAAPSFASTFPVRSDFGDFDINWQSNGGTISYYRLQSRLNNQSWPVDDRANDINYGVSGQTSYAPRGQLAGQYQYRLKACNEDQCNDSWVMSPVISVHNLQGIGPVVATESTSVAGAMAYSAQVNFQGDAEIRVPVQLAPGVNKLQPNLSINYFSGQHRRQKENSLPEDILGYGWHLGGLSEIRRCVTNRAAEVELQLDNSDALCLSGEPLVLSAGSHWQLGAVYHTLRDQFVRVELKGSLEEPWFEVKHADGSIHQYGASVESRIRIENVDGASPYFAWSINKVTDTFNNEVIYTYHRDLVNGINYPLEITYGNNGDAKVEFAYATRDDAAPMPIAETGFEQGQLVLLHHINVFLNNTLQREYRLIPETVPVLGWKRLDKIQLCAYEQNGVNYECLSPLDFDWMVSESANAEEFLTAVNLVNDGMKSTQFDFTMMDESITDADLLEAPFGPGALPANTSDLQPGNGEYRYVVTAQHQDDGLGGKHITTYAYQGKGVESNLNWGFLGYYAQRVHNTRSGVTTYRQLRLDFPHVGRVARLLQYDNIYGTHNELLTEQRFNYGQKSLSMGAATIILPYEKGALSYIYESNVNLGVSYTSTEYNVSGGLVTGMVSTHRIAEGGSLSGGGSFWGDTPTVNLSTIKRSRVNEVTFLNRISGNNWLLGFNSSQTISDYDGDTTGAAERIQSLSATAYGNTNRIDILTQYPGDAKYELVTDYSYDGKGNLTGEAMNGVGVLARTSSASSFLDGRYPQIVVNAESHSMAIEYDERFGVAVEITDANQRVTNMTYDPFGRERSRTTPDQVTIATNYTDCTYLSCPLRGTTPVAYQVRTSSALTPTTDTYFDSLGRPVRTEYEAFDGSSTIITDRFYDNIGRLQQQTLPYFAHEGAGASTMYSYDIRNRVADVFKPDGSALKNTYTALPANHELKVETVEDVYSTDSSLETQSKQQFYSITGDLARIVDDATGNTVAIDYVYYGSGLVKSVQIDNNLATESSYIYDTAGYRSSMIDPNLGTVTTEYNALGQLVSQTDNKEQVTSYEYDLLGRIETQTDSQGIAKWGYDPVNGVGALDYRQYIEAGSQVFYEAHTYTAAAKLNTITTDLTAGGLSRSYQHSYGYDGYGRLENITYPNGGEVHYQYNARGYLAGITDGVSPLKTFNSLNAMGQVEEEVYGNQVITNRTYNPETGRLENLVTSGAAQIQNNTYRWRSNGTLESRLATAGGVKKEEFFVYDGLNRLEQSNTFLNDVAQRSLTNIYDNLGNISQKSSSLGSDTGFVYQLGDEAKSSPNTSSQVSVGGINYSLHFDANGAIDHYASASGNDKWVRWNGRNLPEQITLGSSADMALPTARDRFQYGPNGQRFYRESSWLDDNQQLQTEKVFYVGQFEDQLPASNAEYLRIQKANLDSSVVHITATDINGITTDSVEYLHRDHLGSVESVTDASGATLLNLAYDPFGKRRHASWNGEMSDADLKQLLYGIGVKPRRGFTGHEHLDRTGLIHMNGRVYDPTLGRFLSPDPTIPVPTNSQSWNRYSYVFNNPMGYTDPSGFAPVQERVESKCVDSSCTTTQGGASGQAKEEVTVIGRQGGYGGSGSSSGYVTSMAAMTRNGQGLSAGGTTAGRFDPQAPIEEVTVVAVRDDSEAPQRWSLSPNYVIIGTVGFNQEYFGPIDPSTFLVCQWKCSGDPTKNVYTGIILGNGSMLDPKNNAAQQASDVLYGYALVVSAMAGAAAGGSLIELVFSSAKTYGAAYALAGKINAEIVLTANIAYAPWGYFAVATAARHAVPSYKFLWIAPSVTAVLVVD